MRGGGSNGGLFQCSFYARFLMYPIGFDYLIVKLINLGETLRTAKPFNNLPLSSVNVLFPLMYLCLEECNYLEQCFPTIFPTGNSVLISMYLLCIFCHKIPVCCRGFWEIHKDTPSVQMRWPNNPLWHVFQGQGSSTVQGHRSSNIDLSKEELLIGFQETKGFSGLKGNFKATHTRSVTLWS